MQTTMIKLLSVLALTAFWPAQSFANNASIYFLFENNTNTTIKVRMNSDQEHSLGPSATREFEFKQKCQKTKDYWYNIYITTSEILSVGEIVFTTHNDKGKHNCKNKVITLKRCNDNSNDNYTVTCSTSGMRVTIKTS